MTRERFKSAGLQAICGVAAQVGEIWPLLDAPGAFEADPIWRKSR